MKRVTPQADIFFQEMLDRLAALPGVKAVAMASEVLGHPLQIVGQELPPGRQAMVGLAEVSAGYFNTLQIPLVKGRFLSEEDRQQTPWVIVINQVLAERFFPGLDPSANLSS